MIGATLEFQPRALASVVEGFLALPEDIRPTQYSVGEDEDREPIPDCRRLLDSEIGFNLWGSRATYDICPAAGSRPIICNCYLEVQPSLAKSLLTHMAVAQPIFAFACAPEEREYRNRVTTKQGVNTIDSWVGRDTQRYVPGFYWLTLLPEALAEKHGVPLSTVEKIAQEHAVLAGNQHLFRFYKQPEDWRTASGVAKLCSSLPGVFDVESVKPQLASAKSFLELHSRLSNWK